MSKDNLNHPYVLVGTIFMAMLSLAGVIWQANQGQVGSCINESISLREDNERLLRENVGLITQLAREINTIEVLESTLDGLMHPVWINGIHYLDSPNEFGNMVEFRMIRINTAYQHEYEISQNEYAGKLSYQVWRDRAVAESFHLNDLEALRKGVIQTSETFPSSATDPNAPLVTMKIDKVLISLPNGDDAIIGLAYRFNK